MKNADSGISPERLSLAMFIKNIWLRSPKYGDPSEKAMLYAMNNHAKEAKQAIAKHCIKTDRIF